MIRYKKNYLQQHIYSPTRARGSATPHLLDLIITDESFVENIDFDDPLGKSDNSTIRVSCKVNPITKISTGKPGFSKGNYDGMRNRLKSIRWRDLMSPHTDNIEEMWNVFKCELQESINTFIPTIRNFNSIKKRVMD